MSFNFRILITGASGFIGKHLTPYLNEQGHTVFTIGRDNSNPTPDFVFNGELSSLIEFIKVSKPDCVIHLATHFVPVHKHSDIDPLIEANISFGLSLAEACLACDVRKFLNIGTVWQNYNSDQYNPVSLYAATKEAFSNILKYYSSAHDFSVINLKLSDTYGPHDTRKKVLNLFSENIKNQDNLEMSPGEQYLNFLYIDDVVRGFVSAVELLIQTSPGSFSEYYLLSEEYIQLKKLAQLFEEITLKKLKIKWGALPYRPREQLKLREFSPLLPNWNPQISLKEGLKKFLEQYKDTAP